MSLTIEWPGQCANTPRPDRHPREVPMAAKATCSVEGCRRACYGRGWCGMHYQRWYHNGDPTLSRIDRSPSLAERLSNRTRRTESCWLWTGSTDGWGYGLIWFDSQEHRAHRLAYELALGPIPAGLLVCHTCDNPPCVRPDHLFVGTNADNAHDRDRKGRQVSRSGELSGRAVLTADDVLTIRRLHANGEAQADLAVRFGVSRPNIGYIVRRDTWKHV